MADTIGTAYIQIQPEAKGIQKSIEEAIGGGGSNYGAALSTALGTAAKVGVAAIGAATAAVGGFAASSVQAGMSFDSSMSQVAATMGLTVNEIGDLRDFAQEMGSTTAFSATQAADALNYMALAGYDSETSMKMLPNVLDLAAAGGIELARASDMVTDAQSALGLSLDQTNDMVNQMAAASSKSNTSVEQLGDAFLKIGATARNVKGGTQELSTVLGVLADNGIKGSEGGTHLRNILLSLQSAAEDGVVDFGDFGVAVYDAEGNMRSMIDIVADMQAGLGDMDQASRDAIISGVFNKTDLSSVNALLGTSQERFSELYGAIGNCGDAAARMAETQLDNLEGDITLFKSALEGAQIAVSDGLTPTLREFVQFGSDGLSQVTQAFLEDGLSGAVTAFGEVLSEGLSLLISMLPDFIDAGMQLLGAVGQGILDNLPVIIEAAIEVISTVLEGLIGALPRLIEGALQIILTLADGIAEMLPKLIPTIVDVMIKIVETLIENVDMLVESAIAIIMALAEGLINAMPLLLEKSPILVANLVAALIENAPQLIAAALQLILQLGQALISYIPQLLAVVPTIIAELVGKLVALASELMAAGREFVEKIKKAISDSWSSLLSLAGSKVQELKSKFLEGVKNFSEIGSSIIDGIKKGIQNGWKALKEYVSNQAKSLLDSAKRALGIHSPSRAFADLVGAQIPAGIAMGIENNLGVIDRMVDTMSSRALRGASLTMAMNGSEYAGVQGGYSQTVNIYSPQALSPSEAARQTRNATRNMVLAMRGV